MKILYFLDIFPKTSETFVRDEVTWVAHNLSLDSVIAFDEEASATPHVATSVLDRVCYESRRRPRKRVRRRLALYWLVRAPYRFKIAYVKSRQSPHLDRCFWVAARIARNLGRSSDTVIHVHFAGVACQVANYVSQLTGIPFVVCTHAYDIFSSPPENYPDLADTAARVVTISKYNKRYLVEKHDIPEDRIEVVHCGISSEWAIRPVCDVSGASIRQRPVELVTVGRLVEKKGHEYLVKACAVLRDSGLPFRLTIVGEGSCRRRLESLIRKMALNDQVRLVGEQSSAGVHQILDNADLFVMPSLSEGIPVAIMEAMAAGIPVIATDITGVSELVEHGVTGWLTEAASVEGLVEVIRHVLDNAVERDRCVEVAHDRVRREFDAETNYRRTVAVWQSALQFGANSGTGSARRGARESERLPANAMNKSNV